MFEADITKVVEEMAVRIRETEEDFILDTIFPYCQETLQRKINKAELKQIVLRGSRPKGKWIDFNWNDGDICRWGIKCSECHTEYKHGGEMRHNPKFCPNCGSYMGGGADDE